MLGRWTDPANSLSWPRVWVVVVYSLPIALMGGVISSTLPAKPREALKSLVLGFGLDAAVVLARLQ